MTVYVTPAAKRVQKLFAPAYQINFKQFIFSPQRQSTYSYASVRKVNRNEPLAALNNHHYAVSNEYE